MITQKLTKYISQQIENLLGNLFSIDFSLTKFQDAVFVESECAN